MNKSEIRKARKAARANGIPLTGDLALSNETFDRQSITIRRVGPIKTRRASRAEQHARYLDAGPQNWDDRQ